jgi:outer membrane protein assembly factor BamA
VAAHQDLFTPSDLALIKTFEESDGTSASVVAAYVRDTAIGSYDTQGPLNGNLMRFQFEFAPPLPGKTLSYTTVSADTRKYFRLSRGSLFAVRGYASASSNITSGNFQINSVNEFRGFPYGNFVGNQFFYSSAELRFPLIDAIVFAGGMPIGPIRGIIFGDVGAARFSDLKLPAHTGASMGGVIQLVPFNWAVVYTDKDGIRDKKYTFYMGFNW